MEALMRRKDSTNLRRSGAIPVHIAASFMEQHHRVEDKVAGMVKERGDQAMALLVSWAGRVSDGVFDDAHQQAFSLAAFWVTGTNIGQIRSIGQHLDQFRLDVGRQTRQDMTT